MGVSRGFFSDLIRGRLVLNEAPAKPFMLKLLEKTVEALTGEPVEVLRARSLEEGRRLAELRNGAPMRFSGDPEGVILTHERVEADLDRALDQDPRFVDLGVR